MREKGKVILMRSILLYISSGKFLQPHNWLTQLSSTGSPWENSQFSQRKYPEIPLQCSQSVKLKMNQNEGPKMFPSGTFRMSLKFCPWWTTFGKFWVNFGEMLYPCPTLSCWKAGGSMGNGSRGLQYRPIKQRHHPSEWGWGEQVSASSQSGCTRCPQKLGLSVQWAASVV